MLRTINTSPQPLLALKFLCFDTRELSELLKLVTGDVSAVFMVSLEKNALPYSPSTSTGGRLWRSEKRVSVSVLFGSHCFGETMVSKMKCRQPKSWL